MERRSHHSLVYVAELQEEEERSTLDCKLPATLAQADALMSMSSPSATVSN